MKKLKWFVIACVAIIISVCALSGCINKKVAVGKYYADGNTESYIEILKDRKALFVNIDFSDIQAEHDKYGENINLSEILSEPVPYYEVALSDHITFKYNDYYGLWATYDYENYTITLAKTVYVYQN